MIALGRALRARGHAVCLQTWERWREHVEAEGMRFARAPEYHDFPAGPGELGFYEAAECAARETVPLVRDERPDVVVADILTLAPALAAEAEGVPWATLIPHVYPPDAPGLPIYSFGARLPRTVLGRRLWESVKGPMRRGVAAGRRDLNEIRTALGLPATEREHGGISPHLALVATFPQLEYPRPWPPGVHVVGPLIWEPPAQDTEIPAGAGPLVLVAPSTSQDPHHRLLRAALEGLADMPVRVLATWNRRTPERPLAVPANATVLEWLSYARTMPHADLVVCHAGHGTLARALACGRPVVACPVAGDMNENAARLAWAGAGVRVPRRFITARVIARAVERVLAEPALGERARQLAEWAERHDAGRTAVAAVEALASRSPPATPRGAHRVADGAG
ncbi:MAG: glycosyl transferase, partial [Acidobacteriota bacterium]|nr:glycosyl transferase [Acidobacteriota bacterium]